MMGKFEVQEFCLCGGWTNTWNDDNGATYFNTEEEAQAELEFFFKDMQEEVEAGNIEDFSDREDFRIVEIKNEKNE